MALYLGVDGGGSGCRAAVADAAGRVLGQGAAASANIWTDPEGARANILAAAQAALGRGGAAPGSATWWRCSGSPGRTSRARRSGWRRGLPFARVAIESDAVVALKGALGDDDGITAAIGTGSVFGVQRGGGVRMIGGWGFQLGDHGSGAAMGRALCVRALLAHDGEVGRDAGAGGAHRRARRAGGDRRLGEGGARLRTSRGWCRASSRRRRPATRRRRRSSTGPRPRSRGRSTG